MYVKIGLEIMNKNLLANLVIRVMLLATAALGCSPAVPWPSVDQSSPLRHYYSFFTPLARPLSGPMLPPPGAGKVLISPTSSPTTSHLARSPLPCP